ncbi:heme transporter [Gordonia sp. (in: high G+C Gram-positive bacteria)]|uniref:heme transporter n=1 Tax=Gordonia sp. (in: high G+C Gram-positive bacteria) TaxID=84139 RepID=UPI0039E42F55
MSITTDLQRLLAAPETTATVVDRPAGAVLADLPLLQDVVGVTAAGPVITNDLGPHHRPARRGDPLRPGGADIALRAEPDFLTTVLVTEPTAQIPPTVRFFDGDGNAAHITYLVDGSDRLAFETLRMSRPSDVDLRDLIGDERTIDVTARGAADDSGLPEDQLALFDAILQDCGRRRPQTLEGREGCHRVPVRAAAAALAHAALLAMPVTTCTAAPGCLQIRHDRFDGSREHAGSMVLAAGTARTMINLNLVGQCWVTRAEGVWGPTGAIELYDRRGRCCFVATQTGPVHPSSHDGWQDLVDDLADTRR